MNIPGLSEMEAIASTAARDRAPYVLVDGTGWPNPWSRKTDAVAAFIKSGAGYITASPGDISAQLDRFGRAEFFEHRDGCQPVVRALFATYGRAAGDFYNAHLRQRADSMSYLMTAGLMWASRPGPRVGDYVIHDDETGAATRFTHDWGDDIQAGGGAGSYHISRDGLASYSGGLTDPIDKARLRETDGTRWGEFWFFLDGWPGAHRGVGCRLPCRVYRIA